MAPTPQKPLIEPRWDLTHLGITPMVPNVEREQQQILALIDKFQQIFLKSDISPEELHNVLRQKDRIEMEVDRFTNFTLLFTIAYYDHPDKNHFNDLASNIDLHHTKTALFDIWWRELDENNVERLLKKPSVYNNYLRNLRSLNHLYTTHEEDKNYYYIVDDYRQLLENIDKNIYNLIPKSTKDVGRKNNELRNKIILQESSKYESQLGDIYQKLINCKNNIAKTHKYDSFLSLKNAENQLSDDIFETLLTVAKKNSNIFQKYFNKKAKFYDIDINIYDLSPLLTVFDVKKYSYEEAKQIVLKALEKFSPKFNKYAKLMFNKNHIGIYPKFGHSIAAFTTSKSPKAYPYIYLQDIGLFYDMSTLIHELGHAIHYISSSNIPSLIKLPVLLGETASTFSELLLYDYLSYDELLLERLHDYIIGTLYSTLFEIETYSSPHSPNELSNLYLKNTKKQFGNSVQIYDDYKINWTIDNPFNNPFRTYPYLFGNLMALAIFKRYKEDKDTKPYIEILSAGGSLKPEDLFIKHDMDIRSEKFWQGSFDYIKEKIESSYTGDHISNHYIR